MLNKRFTKKVIKEILRQKENNLVRLNFDYYYSKKQLRAISETAELKNLEDKLTILREHISVEKLKGKDKNKSAILDWESETKKTEREISGINELTREFQSEVRQAKDSLFLGREVVFELRKLIRNPMYIYEQNKDIEQLG